jgi:putative DNA primase/helicase
MTDEFPLPDPRLANKLKILRLEPNARPCRSNGGATFSCNAVSASPKRTLIMQCAADITVKPPEWLWPGRVAIGKLTLIAGEAGLGKSQVSIAMAGAVTTGGPWPCGEDRSPLGDVIFLCAEDGAADTIVPRLMAIGANLRRVHIITAVGSSPL